MNTLVHNVTNKADEKVDMDDAPVEVQHLCALVERLNAAAEELGIGLAGIAAKVTKLMDGTVGVEMSFVICHPVHPVSGV